MYGQIGLFVEAWWLTVGPNTCNLLSSNPCIPLSRLHLRSNLLQRVYVYTLGLLYTQVCPKMKWKHLVQNIHIFMNTLIVLPKNFSHNTMNNASYAFVQEHNEQPLKYIIDVEYRNNPNVRKRQWFTYQLTIRNLEWNKYFIWYLKKNLVWLV